MAAFSLQIGIAHDKLIYVLAVASKRLESEFIIGDNFDRQQAKQWHLKY